MKSKFQAVWKVIGPVFKAIFGIIKIFFDVCFLIVLVYGILCIPLLAGYKSYVISDSNNEIKYKEGTLLYYKKVQEGEIFQNDVVVYQPKNELIFHKVQRVIMPSEQTEDETVLGVDGEKLEDELKEYSYEVEIDSYHKEYPNIIEHSALSGKVAPIHLVYAGFFVRYIQNNMSIFYIILGISAFDLLLSFLPSPKKK